MNAQRFKWASGILLSGLMLSACSGGTQRQSQASGPSTLFTLDHVYGAAAPVGAALLTPEDFEKKIGSGELLLDTAEQRAARRSAQQAQFAKDRAFLEALPDQSEALKSMLGPKAQGSRPDGGDLQAQATGNSGKSIAVVTMGEAVTFRNAVAAYQGSRDPATLLAVYAAALPALDEADRANLPAPQKLAGQPLARVQQALSNLDAALGQQVNLDAVVTLGSGAQRLHPQTVTVTDGGANAGNGSDSSGTCGNYAPQGFFARLNWPLKAFLTPVKQQGRRGTCWAFASVAYLETRERVVGDHPTNLSEQYFVNVHKRDALADFDVFGEGDLTFTALNNFSARHLAVAPESAWTYNPASRRAADPAGPFPDEHGVCDDYSGPCSESTHQSPTACASVAAHLFCGYESVEYRGSGGVLSDPAYPFWLNLAGLGGELPVDRMRALLANGQPLIASLDAHPGFMNPNSGTDDRGYVTDFTDHNMGGHVVLLVGFIPDAFALSAPSISGGSGGGYFVVKNSWGCDYGDSGYVYLPVRYARRFFTTLAATTMTSVRSAALASLRARPDLSSARILSPVTGATFNVDMGSAPNFYKDVTLSARATRADGSPFPSDRYHWKVAETDHLDSTLDLGSAQTLTARLFNPQRNSARHNQITLEMRDDAGRVIPALTRNVEVTVLGAPD